MTKAGEAYSVAWLPWGCWVNGFPFFSATILTSWVSLVSNYLRISMWLMKTLRKFFFKWQHKFQRKNSFYRDGLFKIKNPSKIRFCTRVHWICFGLEIRLIELMKWVFQMLLLVSVIFAGLFETFNDTWIPLPEWEVELRKNVIELVMYASK